MSDGAFAAAGPRRATWLAVLAGLGVFLAADDQTSVVAILPQMVSDIGLAQDQFYRAAWIVNGYILGYIVAMPLMGRIADSFGHARVFAAALGVFCAGSLAVSLAGDLTTLIIARAVQALGGGAVVPVALAIVSDSFSRERRAFALGAIAAASEGGALIGPLWGGGIAELLGWRAVFWLNLPLVLPVIFVVWRLRDDHATGSWRGIDFPGALLLGLSLTALTIALTDDPIQPRATLETLALYGVAVALFALFILRQRRALEPVVRLTLFRSPPLSAGFATNLLAGGCLIVALVSVPLFTNVVLGDSALQGGLNLMRLSVGLAIGALAGGYLTSRLGSGLTAALGFVCAGAGFVGMTAWDADSGFIVFTLPLLVGGLGFGLVIAPVNAAVLDAVEAGERATVAALLTVVRLLGGLVGVALLTSRGLGGFYGQAALIPLDDPRFLDRVRDLQVGTFHDVFIVTAAVCFISVLPALGLGRNHEAGVEPTKID